MSSGEQVRKVLRILLQLNGAASSGGRGHGMNPFSFWRAQRVLQAMVDSPDLVALPSLRKLAELTLLNFEKIERGKPYTPAAPPSIELDAIDAANKEITAILPLTETAYETLIYNYISDSLQSRNFNQEPLNQLVGYEFTAHGGNVPHSMSIRSPHIERAREILGSAISETMEVCGGF